MALDWNKNLTQCKKPPSKHHRGDQTGQPQRLKKWICERVKKGMCGRKRTQVWMVGLYSFLGYIQMFSLELKMNRELACDCWEWQLFITVMHTMPSALYPGPPMQFFWDVILTSQWCCAHCYKATYNSGTNSCCHIIHGFAAVASGLHRRSIFLGREQEAGGVTRQFRGGQEVESNAEGWILAGNAKNRSCPLKFDLRCFLTLFGKERTWNWEDS